jgi:hypothetical protein
LYESLSTVSMRLADPQGALDAAMFAHSLDPADRKIYLALARILLSQGRNDEAATMLVEGLVVSGSVTEPEFLEPLRVLYRMGLDPQGCAIVQGRNGPGLNTSCATVRNEVCKASADLVTVNRRVLRFDSASSAEELHESFNCR